MSTSKTKLQGITLILFDCALYYNTMLRVQVASVALTVLRSLGHHAAASTSSCDPLQGSDDDAADDLSSTQSVVSGFEGSQQGGALDEEPTVIACASTLYNVLQNKVCDSVFYRDTTSIVIIYSSNIVDT
jgi:hypothetical protein